MATPFYTALDIALRKAVRYLLTFKNVFFKGSVVGADALRDPLDSKLLTQRGMVQLSKSWWHKGRLIRVAFCAEMLNVKLHAEPAS